MPVAKHSRSLVPGGARAAGPALTQQVRDLQRFESDRFRACWENTFAEEKALKLEDAVRRMTSKPPVVFGFDRRGVLKAGNFADIVIFNPDTIIDTGTFVEPIQFPEGIEYVLINGHVVLDSGRVGRTLAGEVPRKSRTK